MEGFKKLPKGVACFKEGGAVYKSRHSEKKEISEDIAKDKQIVKKAVSIHDKQQHQGEKTDLSKLKKGGRAKKEGGCVGRYKAGGAVENAYGTPKTKKDIKDIANTKRQKPKKMQAGGMTGMGNVSDAERALVAGGLGQVSDLEKRRMMERKERAKKYLGPSQQQEFEAQEAAAMRGQGAVSDNERGLLGKLMGRKKGGKVCK